MASFHDFAELCQSLGQTGSRRQMAEMAGGFLARLEADEAGLAARFMAGRALVPGEEKKLRFSGRAIWKIVAAMTGGEDQGEEIFAATADFGEAIEMLLRLRPAEPEPTLTIREVAAKFAAIAGMEGRHSRARKLKELGELFAYATALEGKYLAKVLTRGMRHGVSEGLMLEAMARMANRPAAEVRRAHMLEGDLAQVVRAPRSRSGAGAGAGGGEDAGVGAGSGSAGDSTAPAAPVAPGVRGRGWLSIKRAHTLDLVIAAADWGHGRRKEWLSNYHLAARDEKGGGFIAVGKTRKGLTDEEAQAMTGRLLGLQLEETHGTVTVRPEVVVEVAYSGIQRSSQYPAGMALRFARIVAIREDQRPEETDTIEMLARELERPAPRPATPSPGGPPEKN